MLIVNLSFATAFLSLHRATHAKKFGGGLSVETPFPCKLFTQVLNYCKKQEPEATFLADSQKKQKVALSSG